jgi:hypothetical protein
MSTTITPTEQNIEINVNNDVIDINVTNEIVDVNATTQQIDINVAGAYPLPSSVTSVFGRIGDVVAIEGDYTLTQLGDVTLSSPSNGQVLKYNGTAWVNSTDADTGITTLNTLTALSQTFATGTSGTDFNISSATSTHTFNIPTASAINRGLLSSTDWTTFNNKQDTITNPVTGTGTANTIPLWNASSNITNSVITQVSGNIRVGSTTQTSKLNVGGDIDLSGVLKNNGTQIINVGSGSLALGDGTGKLTTSDIIVNTSPFTITIGSSFVPYAFTNFGSITGSSFIRSGGTSSQFLKADGSVDSTSYQPTLTNPITGTGTSGQIAYFNGTSSLTSESNLFWDATNDRLGIGNASPTNTLDVNGTARFLNNIDFQQLIVGRTSTRNFSMTWDDPQGEGIIQSRGLVYPITLDGSTIKFRSSNGTRMRIFETGNVLIQSGGTFTDNGFRLDVNGTSRIQGDLDVIVATNFPRVRVGNTNVRSFSMVWDDTISEGLIQSASRAFPITLDGNTIKFLTQGTLRMRVFEVSGNVGINTGNTDAGFRLDVNGTARTQQLHSFLLGTLLDSTSASNFYSVNTGGSTYGGLALRNQTQDYTGYIQTGRSGNANGINFFHTTFAGATSGDGHQKFSSTAVVFGSLSKPQTLTIYKVGGSAGTAQYPLVLNNQTNTTNTGVGLIFQTGNETGGGPIDHANITAFKTNLGSGFVTSNLRFSTISDGANTLSEKMRISDASNLLIGTTTDLLARLQVSGSITASSAIARGGLINTTLVAAANNDVLVGLDINPTFTNGAFTGVENFALRVNGNIASTSGNNQVIFTSVSATTGWQILRMNSSGASLNFGIEQSAGASRFGNTLGYSSVFGTTNATALHFATNNLTRATIFSNGNFLIAPGIQTDAGFRLDVNGTARVQSTMQVATTLTVQRNQSVGDVTLSLDNSGGVSNWKGSIAYRTESGGSNQRMIFNAQANDVISIFSSGGRVLMGSGHTLSDYVSSAALAIVSTVYGFLPPRMTTTQKNAISSPATGLVVFDTTLGKLCVFSTTWQTITSL